MSTRNLARHVASLSHILTVMSLFFVLIWWRVSLELLLAGCAGYATVWLLGGGLPGWIAPALPE